MKTEPRSDPNDFASRYRTHRRLVRLGQAIMLIGFLVAVTHWLAHLEAFGAGQPPGLDGFRHRLPDGCRPDHRRRHSCRAATAETDDPVNTGNAKAGAS